MRKTLIGILIGMCLMTGCATRPVDPDEMRVFQELNDPMEPMNRAIFSFNITADEYVIQPIARGYRFVVPEFVRNMVGDFFQNLHQPVYMLNAALQGDGTGLLHATGRFVVNTVWGFFGLFDVATAMDIQKPDNDFGQTLAKWGIENGGPYLMLPFLGPSNPRDVVGLAADSVMTPAGWYLVDEPLTLYGLVGLENFDKRERALEFLESLEKTSTDFYATTRSMYQQNRRKKLGITATETPDGKQDYEFDFDFDFDDDDLFLE